MWNEFETGRFIAQKAQKEGRTCTKKPKKRKVKRETRVGERGGDSVIKRRCVTPFSSDNFEESSPMEELEGVGDSCGDSFGFSVCVFAVSTGVLVVTDVLVSLLSMGVLG